MPLGKTIFPFHSSIRCWNGWWVVVTTTSFKGLKALAPSGLHNGPVRNLHKISLVFDVFLTPNSLGYVPKTPKHPFLIPHEFLGQLDGKTSTCLPRFNLYQFWQDFTLFWKFLQPNLFSSKFSSQFGEFLTFLKLLLHILYARKERLENQTLLPLSKNSYYT